jgi:hypothetical protein
VSHYQDLNVCTFYHWGYLRDKLYRKQGFLSFICCLITAWSYSVTPDSGLFLSKQMLTLYRSNWRSYLYLKNSSTQPFYCSDTASAAGYSVPPKSKNTSTDGNYIFKSGQLHDMSHTTTQADSCSSKNNPVNFYKFMFLLETSQLWHSLSLWCSTVMSYGTEKFAKNYLMNHFIY